MCLEVAVIKSNKLSFIFCIISLIVTSSVLSREIIDSKTSGFIFDSQNEIRIKAIDFAKLDGNLPNKLLNSLALTSEGDSIIKLEPFDSSGENLIKIIYKSRLVVDVKVKDRKYDVFSVGYSIY
ncbi:hypothetical protein AB4298_05790 [Shewanella sp. 10N.261.52.F9]|uniref:hypothetical protein n=1 Tax=Shewanella sp. 10N.261.52.F9 TaxID=3229684 RepID=UPI003553AA26